MRLIDADKFILALMDASLASVDEDTILDLIDTVDTIEAKPVVHGRWEESTEDWFETLVYTCSKCREDYVLVEGTPKQNLWNYCPNCGAKMDGDKEAT